MSALDQLLKVRSAHSRSTNVELDKSQDSLNRYIPTGRSLEVVSRSSVLTEVVSRPLLYFLAHYCEVSQMKARSLLGRH